MATKDITDLQVLQAFIDSRKSRDAGVMVWPEALLMDRTGQCEKVCFRAMERTQSRDLIEFGVSLRSGWLTDKGRELMGLTLHEPGHAFSNSQADAIWQTFVDQPRMAS